MPSHFAIAAGHPLTSEAGADVLRAGGTAVDACIAAALMANVVEPVLASILGGGFFMIAPKDHAAICLDAFVETPLKKRPASEIDFRAIEANFGDTTQIFQMGAGSIATPGMAQGLFAAHTRFGRIPMAELAAPAVKAARDGVTMRPFPARIFEIVGAIYEAEPCARAVYAPDGHLLKEGETLRNPALADVLDVMACEGARFITEGEVGQALLALAGGHLSAADLKAYAPQWRKPLGVNRAGHDIALNPAPSLGGAQIALALGALPAQPTPGQIAHVFELIAQARDTRPDLLCETLLENLRNTLKNHAPATRGTTHISAIDRDGNGAALTLSNGEGCGLILPGTGLMPNNMLGEEDLVPGGWHSWPEGQRLASGMCPMAMRGPEGGITLMGSGGSNRIRTAITQVALHVIDHGLRLEDAISAPRLHAEGAPARVDFEDRYADADRDALRAAFPRAHGWQQSSMFFGGVHAVGRDAKGGLEAAADPRREGVAIIG